MFITHMQDELELFVRMVPIYNQFEHQWIEREHSVAFANNAYISVHPNEFE